jgi:hypothetical protein
MSAVKNGSRQLDLIQLRYLCKVLGYALPKFITEYEAALAAGELNPRARAT